MKVFVSNVPLTHRRLTRGLSPGHCQSWCYSARAALSCSRSRDTNQLTTAFVAQRPLLRPCPVISPVAASVASFLTAHYNSQMKEEQL